MTARLGLIPIAAAILLALLVGVQRADAASYLGSPDTSAPPDAYVGGEFPPGTSVGFEQFALRGATIEAPEPGVLVSASAYAKRIAGSEQPRIAVLRQADDGIGANVVASAPLPVSAATGALHEVEELHLPVQTGDTIGLLFRTGEVELGTKTRTRPDGAVQSFTQPCGPCGMDGGTGVELLYDAVVEPDVDEDGLGDETQDPDGGGLGEDWEGDWFEDFEEGDELDEDFFEEDAMPRARRRLRLLDVERRRGGGASALLRVPKAGRLSAAITLPANRRTGAGPFLTILAGDMRVKRPGRVRLRLASTPPGARVLSRRKRLRTKVVASFLPRNGSLKVRMRSARL